MNNIIINFPEQYFTMERDGKVSRHHFAYDNDIRSTGVGDIGQADHSTKTSLDCMQVAASLISNRSTADYIKHHLRSGLVNEVGVVPCSEFKDNDRRYPVGERASGNDNCMMHDSEQVTRGRLN